LMLGEVETSESGPTRTFQHGRSSVANGNQADIELTDLKRLNMIALAYPRGAYRVAV